MVVLRRWLVRVVIHVESRLPYYTDIRLYMHVLRVDAVSNFPVHSLSRGHTCTLASYPGYMYVYVQLL